MTIHPPGTRLRCHPGFSHDRWVHALPDTWPAEVVDAVTGLVGEVRGSEPLAGLSGREVCRVDGENRRLVVKGDAHPRELAFYRHAAPLLLDLAPTLHWGGEVGSTAWLVLEHLPAPLPRELWTGAEVYDVLAALHTTPGVYDGLGEPFRPEWSDTMTVVAQQATGTDLARLAEGTRALLTGDTPVSGDPNPRNWGVRSDGRIALFDWERAGFAGPGLDVAITLPGLPTVREADDATAAYTSARQRLGAPLDDPLATHALLQLKLWTAVELLAEDRPDDALRETQAWLVSALPAWLASWT
jgi:hypothetical protein